MNNTVSKPFTGTCPKCGDEIAPAATQAQYSRNYGVHMQKRHGIHGSSYHRSYSKKLKNSKAELLEIKRAQLAVARKIRWQNHRKQKRQQAAQPTTGVPMSAVHCKLDSCPHCGTAFYMVVKEGQWQTLKQE